MKNSVHRKLKSRRAAVVVLAAFLMIVMLGIIALAVDTGYMLTVRTQLQVAADSAALAAGANMSNGTRTQMVSTANQFAAYHKASGAAASVVDADVQFGYWDSSARTFTPTGNSVSNAVKVTTRRNNTTGANKLFFGRVFGRNTFDAQASAIAIGNPRDICFCVDLSGSMNDDTEPGWGSGTFSGSNASTYSSMMSNVFSDLNFGSYPGTTQSIGQSLGVDTFSELSASNSPLKSSSIPSTYRITSSDSSSQRATKAYKWIIDNQIATLMPQGRPTPASGNSTSYNYWKQYIDEVEDNNSKVGYRTYVQYMMYYGRDGKPDGSNYTQLSESSSYVRHHSEATAGGTFNFPAREQPTHACRRSIIAALQEIKSKNVNITDPNQRDWVSIVTYDTVAGTTVKYSLSSSYDNAMTTTTTLQACSNGQSSTATETGLIAAQNHIKAASQGGSGRENTQKIVVLLTDGMANLYSSSSSTISSYRTAHPDSDYYGGSGNYSGDAAMMQAATMTGKHWSMYAVGVGLGQDQDFMDRMARMGGTANDAGESPHTSGDPSAYETELTAIFEQIVDNPQVHLVQ